MAKAPRIAYLGPKGTHTETALREFAPQAEGISCLSIAEAFRLVSSREADAGFIAVENVLQGPVTSTLDLLLEHRGQMRILRSHLMPIRNALGLLPGAEKNKINRIYSHEQALSQCSRYLREHFANAELCPVASTGAAAEHVREKNLSSAAVVAPLKVLVDKAFSVLADNISDVPENKTRFVLIALEDTAAQVEKALGNRPLGDGSMHAITSLVVVPGRDRKGLLLEILDVVSKQHAVNLRSIHSRPDQRGGFVFHLDLEGSVENPAIAACISELRRYCLDTTGKTAELFVFGWYERSSFYEPPNHKVGIVGGKGKMGEWFSRFFERAGLEVLICDTDSELTLSETVEQADVILLSLPMSGISSMTPELCRLLEPGQLVVENCSIKSCVLPSLLECAPEGVEVLGIHTMFGSDLESLAGENVIITRTPSSGRKSQALEDLLNKHGARISYSTVDEHDRMSLYMQSLMQFVMVCVGEVMNSSFERARDLDVFSTPNSRGALKILKRVLNQSDELIVDLQTCNEKAVLMRNRFLEVVCRHVFQLNQDNTDEFLQSAQKSRAFLDED